MGQHSPVPWRKYGKALEVSLISLHFLFGVGLLTDNVILPAHSRRVRLEPLPLVSHGFSHGLDLPTSRTPLTYMA